MSQLKFGYFVDGKQVDKTTFYKKLKGHCYDVKHTTRFGDFGVDFTEFNDIKFRQYCRSLNAHKGYFHYSLSFAGDDGEGSVFSIKKMEEKRS